MTQKKNWELVLSPFGNITATSGRYLLQEIIDQPIEQMESNKQSIELSVVPIKRKSLWRLFIEFLLSLMRKR